MNPHTSQQLPKDIQQALHSSRVLAERTLGITLLPRTPRTVLLPSAERNALNADLKRIGATVCELAPGKVDLGYLAKSARFEDQLDALRRCSNPDDAEKHVGQRFVYHGLSALALNLMYGQWVRYPENITGEYSTVGACRNAWFAALKFAESTENGDRLTTYALKQIAGGLREAGISITPRMATLDQIPLLLAVDLQGYKTLPNRINQPFLCRLNSWSLIAACPPPAHAVHIMGTFER